MNLILFNPICTEINLGNTNPIKRKESPFYLILIILCSFKNLGVYEKNKNKYLQIRTSTLQNMKNFNLILIMVVYYYNK